MNTAVLENPVLENNSIDGWPSSVDMKVIDPGVVFYEDLKNDKGETIGGNVLVQKAALDKMAASMEGKPIINWDHRSVQPGEYNKGKFQGIIGKPYFNPETGWYHAPGYVWDEATKRNIQNGYSISCAYKVSEWAEGGTYHKVPYEQEVLNGQYTHIAVVATPRYEGARIELLNSAKGAVMNLLKIFSKDKPEEKIEMDVTKTKVAIDGHGEVPLAEMINSYKKANPVSSIDEKFIMIDGREVSVKELKNSYAKNAENEKDEKDKKEKEAEEEKKNCAICNSAAQHEETNLHEKASALPKTYNSVEDKMKKDDEAKNAAEEEKKKDEDERKNSAARASALDASRNKSRHIEMPSVTNVNAQALEGESRYGSRAVVTK